MQWVIKAYDFSENVCGALQDHFILEPEEIFAVLVQLLSHAQLFVTPWITARHTSMSFTISQSHLI